MPDYIYLDNGIVIDDQGEIIESGNENAMAVIATRRAEAKNQQKRWESIVADYDRVLLRNQDRKRVSYGDVVISVCGGSYPKTNAETFADWVAEVPLEFGDIIQTIASATGFKRDLLPESVRGAFDDATETLQKRSWIESRIAERVAPEFERGPGWEEDDGSL